MAIIVNDTFTEAADTDVSAHTPDTGSQWVQVAQTGTRTIRIIASTDSITGSGSSSAAGEYVKSQPAPTSADVDVQISMPTVDTGTTQARKIRLHARGSGTSDYYALRLSPPASSANDIELVKVVGGTLTSLASIDSGIADGDTFLLEIRSATKRVLRNGVEALSSADNAITAAGDCGISMGQVSAGDTGNIASAFRFDDYSVTEIVTATGHAKGKVSTIPLASKLRGLVS